jgi:hypothetical protein
LGGGGRSSFLRTAVAGREVEVPSLNVRLTGFPPTTGEASDDFLLCTCKPLSSLSYMFPISVYSIYLFSVSFLISFFSFISVEKTTFPNTQSSAIFTISKI